ncbi:MAG: O-antigen ligase family protein [Chloroflexi bacterium]|nr:MAG: O-antigen ligase family protein [Chloroflexota bacterium]
MRHFLERLAGYFPAVVALALPTAFLPTFATDAFILPRAAIVIAGACLGAGLAVLLQGGQNLGSMRWPLATSALAALLAFLFSISWPLSLAGSYTRYESLPVRIAYLGLFAVSVWLIRDRRGRDLVSAAFVLGTAVACVEAVHQWSSQAPYRPDGNLGNANLLGALIAMAAPLALGRAIQGGQYAVAWWMALPVLLAGLLVSTSRSGGLGMLAGCLVVLVFALRGRVAVAAGLASAAAIGLALLFILLSPLRLLNEDPGPARLHLWPDGLHMIAARPLTGWGLDTTGLAYGHFLSGDWSPGVTFDRIHSGPLDLAATQGLIGLAALSWVLITFVRGAWTSRFVARVAPLAAACAGYTVWVAFNFDWAPVTGVFWLLAGTAWSAVREAHSAPRGDRQARAPAWWRSSLAVTAVAAAVVFGTMPVLAETWLWHGRSDLATVVDPFQAQYHWSWGQTLIVRGRLAQGVDELRRAADYGETAPALYVELGDRERELGRPANARAAYRRALFIDPYYGPAKERLAATVA